MKAIEIYKSRLSLIVENKWMPSLPTNSTDLEKALYYNILKTTYACLTYKKNLTLRNSQTIVAKMYQTLFKDCIYLGKYQRVLPSEIFKCLNQKKSNMALPDLLKEFRNMWYMVASANETKHKGGTNLFKLNRIQKIEPCEEAYVIDPKFSVENYFKYSLGVFHIHGAEPIEVKLKFNPFLIPLISETKIHPSMEIISKTEDEMIVTFTVYNTIELKNKILSFGANAEVLSPKVLRDEIIKIIDQTKLVYAN